MSSAARDGLQSDVAVSRFRRSVAWTSDDDESLQILKLAGAIGLLFLLAYTAFDLRVVHGSPSHAGYYWLAVGGTLLFFGVTWTQWFRRFWKAWTLGFCLFLMALMVMISSVTQDPESRCLAMILMPLAAASFVSWGPRWQAALGAGSLGGYALANYLVPISNRFNFYRWLGVLAAVIFAQATATFIERYRLRLRGQLAELEAAARFRETQIATMAHDIRSPVAALAGYAELLGEDQVSPAERSELLARISSTAWNTNLVVTNVLDLYRFEENARSELQTARFDPNPTIAEVSEDCSAQARRKGLDLEASAEQVPEIAIEPSQLERIVRNLAAQAIARSTAGRITLRVSSNDGHLVVQVSAPQAKPSAAELRQMVNRPNENGGRGLGLYVARLIAESAQGTVNVSAEPDRGLLMTAELPLASSAPHLPAR